MQNTSRLPSSNLCQQECLKIMSLYLFIFFIIKVRYWKPWYKDLNNIEFRKVEVKFDFFSWEWAEAKSNASCSNAINC